MLGRHIWLSSDFRLHKPIKKKTLKSSKSQKPHLDFTLVSFTKTNTNKNERRVLRSGAQHSKTTQHWHSGQKRHRLRSLRGYSSWPQRLQRLWKPRLHLPPQLSPLPLSLWSPTIPQGLSLSLSVFCFFIKLFPFVFFIVMGGFGMWNLEVGICVSGERLWHLWGWDYRHCCGCQSASF